MLPSGPLTSPHCWSENGQARSPAASRTPPVNAWENVKPSACGSTWEPTSSPSGGQAQLSTESVDDVSSNDQAGAGAGVGSGGVRR